MSKQSKRIKPNSPKMMQVNIPAANPQSQAQPGQFDFSKVHIHFGIPCYGCLLYTSDAADE